VSRAGFSCILGFDPVGNLYIADSGAGVTRVRLDASVDAEWASKAPKSFDFLGGGIRERLRP
jgi:hypothetical protein